MIIIIINHHVLGLFGSGISGLLLTPSTCSACDDSPHTKKKVEFHLHIAQPTTVSYTRVLVLYHKLETLEYTLGALRVLALCSLMLFPPLLLYSKVLVQGVSEVTTTLNLPLSRHL